MTRSCIYKSSGVGYRAQYLRFLRYIRGSSPDLDYQLYTVETVSDGMLTRV